MSGVTSAGFEAKTLDEIKAELEADALAGISAGLNVSSASVIGQLFGIFASKVREVWELAQAVYAASYPDTASGESLTAVAAITGTTRRAATYSYVLATVNLDAGTTLPAGSAANVAGDTTRRFATVADVTNGGGAPANVTVRMDAETTGPVMANAGALSVIATPVAGWNSVTNVEDAVLGSDIETDSDLRARREAELRASGSSTLEAIRADLLTLPGMVDAYMFENTTDTPDVNGVPPHAFEAVVFDGLTPALSNSAIAERIWSSKPAGIRAYGLVNVSVEDSRGGSHTVSFSRASIVDVWLTINLTADAQVWPADGVAQVKTKVAAQGDATLSVGEDVARAQFYSAVFAVAGVVDITAFLAGTSIGAQSAANVAIGPREIADLDTGRIAVNVTLV